MTVSKQDRHMLDDQDLYSGLIRLHVLHHAVEEPIFGLGMIEELTRHGYRISPGTLYPLLHGWKKRATCVPPRQRNGKSRRKVYRATPSAKSPDRGEEQGPRTLSRTHGGRLRWSARSISQQPCCRFLFLRPRTNPRPADAGEAVETASKNYPRSASRRSRSTPPPPGSVWRAPPTCRGWTRWPRSIARRETTSSECCFRKM